MAKPNWSEEGYKRIVAASEKTRENLCNEAKARREEYNKNPKRCLHCSNPIEYNKKSSNNFCSRSCSASYNNARKKKKKPHSCTCINCNKVYIAQKTDIGLYCSNQCFHDHKYKERLADWINGSYRPGSRQFIKKYLTETHGYKCSCCGISEWNDKALTLEIDHIDGRSDNNRPENLRLICPNCHSQTATYKSRNRGNGRHFRRERYKNGLSY